MATRYFKAENANREIQGHRFEAVEIFAGTLVGVFATDDEGLAERLSKELGVTQIEQAEYDLARKKKAPTLKDSAPSNPPQQQVAAPSAATLKGGPVGVVINEPVPVVEEPPPGEPVESVESAIQVETVAPPPVEPVVTKPSRRRG